MSSNKQVVEGPIFIVSNVRKTFTSGRETVVALNNANVIFPKGKITAILGPNGSGKSTLLALLGGLISPDSGQICFCNQNKAIALNTLSAIDLQTIRRNHLSMIFQGLNLVSHLKVWQNVALPLVLNGSSWRKANPQAMHFLSLFGLEEKAQDRPNQLSGGQQQRVAICRTLVTNSRVILADEPTARLDGESTKQLMGILSMLSAKRETSVIIATHDRELVRTYCHYAITCSKESDGNIVN